MIDDLAAVEMRVHALMEDIRLLAADLQNPHRRRHVAGELGNLVHAGAQLNNLLHEVQAAIVREAA